MVYFSGRCSLYGFGGFYCAHDAPAVPHGGKCGVFGDGIRGNVAKTRPAFDLVENVSTLLDSTFYKTMKLGFDLVNRYRQRK